MDIINRIFNLGIFRDSIYYKIVFVLWTLLHSLTLGQYITGYFSMPIIVWGGVLVLRNILAKKLYVNKIILFLMCAFLSSYVITIFLNRNLNLMFYHNNHKFLVELFINLHSLVGKLL